MFFGDSLLAAPETVSSLFLIYPHPSPQVSVVPQVRLFCLLCWRCQGTFFPVPPLPARGSRGVTSPLLTLHSLLRWPWPFLSKRSILGSSPRITYTNDHSYLSSTLDLYAWLPAQPSPWKPWAVPSPHVHRRTQDLPQAWSPSSLSQPAEWHRHLSCSQARNPGVILDNSSLLPPCSPPSPTHQWPNPSLFPPKVSFESTHSPPFQPPGQHTRTYTAERLPPGPSHLAWSTRTPITSSPSLFGLSRPFSNQKLAWSY